MARLLFRLLQETNSPSSPATPSPALYSDLVLVIAALLCALICVIGLLAISRCVWLRRLATTRSAASSDQPPANKGLKKKVLKSLPKLTYSPESPPAEKLAECAICLTEFAAGDELRVLPQCGHGFHVSCIDTWLGSHSSCPSCRQILVVVARCQKCGGLPGSSSSGPEPDTRIKQDDTSSNNNDNSLP